MKTKNPFIEKFEKFFKIPFPPEMKEKILKKLDEMHNYTPKVGVFGKTGVGKSSLCNALFGQDVCAVSDVEACTRDAKEVMLSLGGEKGIKLIDVPGVGESSERDKEYDELYQNLLPELDLIFWVFKGDDRAAASDEHFYKKLIRRYVEAGKPFIAVINQVDKIEPFREWDEREHKPGSKQLSNIEKKRAQIAGLLGIPMNKVIAVSANERYGLMELVDSIVHELPNEQKEIVLEKIKAAEEAEILAAQAKAAEAQAALEITRAQAEAERIAFEKAIREAEDREKQRQYELEKERLRIQREKEERAAEEAARRARAEEAERQRSTNISEGARREADRGVWETVKNVASSIWSGIKSLF